MDTVLTILGVTGVLVVIGVVSRVHTKRLMAILQHAATQRGGKVFGDTFLGIPGMSFLHRDHEVHVSLMSGAKNRPPRTHVIAVLALSRDISLSVFLDSLGYKAAKLFGAQDIVIGSEELDKSFAIRGNDEVLARAVLAPPIESGLLKLKTRNVNLTLSQNELKLVVDQYPKLRDDLDPILDLFTSFLDILDQELF